MEELPKIEESTIVIDVNGIGYRIITPKTVAYEAQSVIQNSKPLKLFVESIVREESHTLYGFLSEDDRAVFRLLVSLSGIGPKLAMQVMNRGSGAEILRALAQRDIPWLSSISGVGKKTAERISLEAHEKARDMQGTSFRTLETTSTPSHDSAIDALVSLGLSIGEARQYVQEALKTDENVSDVSQIIHLALLHRKRACSAS